MQIVILLDISTLNKTFNNSTAISIELLNFIKYIYFSTLFKKVSQNGVNRVKTIIKHLIFSFHKEGEQSFIHLFTHSFISQIGVNQAKTIIFSSHKEENNHFIFEL